MRTTLARWRIHHLTDRDVELRKDDYSYRRLTGQDGFVHVRAQPGMDRKHLLERAFAQAEQQDAELSQLLARQLMPSGKQWADYRRQLRQLQPAFTSREERWVIGRKRV